MTAQVKKALAQAEAKAWMEAHRGWDKGMAIRSMFNCPAEGMVDGWSPEKEPVTLSDVLSGRVR